MLKDQQHNIQLEASHCFTLKKILLKGLDDGAGCTLSKSAASWKLGVVINAPVACAAIWMDLGRPGEMGQQEPCKVQQGPAAGRNNPAHQYKLGQTDWETVLQRGLWGPGE